jgi:mRNA interferase RelE/StbE
MGKSWENRLCSESPENLSCHGKGMTGMSPMAPLQERYVVDEHGNRVAVLSEAYERVRDAIRALGQDPRPPGSRQLAGRDGWRLRVGDYGVIYDIDDAQHVVTVLHIGHRRDVYR